MGKVHRARHQRLGRHVALKVVGDELLGNASLVERFLQEGRAVNQINHQHIIEVHDYVEEKDPARVYCVMELLQGQNLTQRLAERPSTLTSIRSMGRQLASALGASHAAGVVHRDLPERSVCRPMMASPAVGTARARISRCSAPRARGENVRSTKDASPASIRRSRRSLTSLRGRRSDLFTEAWPISTPKSSASHRR